MIEYPVTKGILEQASTIANNIPPDIKNSIRSGEGRFVGAIGESIFMRVTGGNKVSTDYYNSDVNWNGVLYEVKTKECTSIPRPHYFASVCNHNPNQNCDRYVFFRVLKRKNENYSKAWLMGWMEPEEFFDNATFYRRGDVDPSSTFGWTFRESCYNVPYSKLHQFQKECEAA